MNYAQTFLMTNSSSFPAESIPMIQKEINELDEQSLNSLLMTELKNPTTALIFAILFGEYGVDRFYNKDTGLGVAKLALTVLGWLTSWIFIGFFFLLAVYVWKIADCFMIMGAVRQGNLERLMTNIQIAKNSRNRKQTEPTVELAAPVVAEEVSVEATSEEVVSEEVAVVEVVEEVVESPEAATVEVTETVVEVSEEIVAEEVVETPETATEEVTVEEVTEPVSEEAVAEEATSNETTETTEG